MEDRILCPIINEFIDREDCFDVHMVIEDGAPVRTALKKICDVKNFKIICLKCKYHRDD